MANNKIIVEVAYATPHEQRIVEIEVERGITIERAIDQSGIIALFPEINLSKQKVGVFGKHKKLDDVLSDGDRVEIYRPLTIDPKEARRAKAKKS